MNPTSFGLLTGTVAGGLAAFVMDRVDWYAYRHEKPSARRHTIRARPGGRDPAHEAVHRMARALGTKPPRPSRQNALGLAMHYGIGILPAALYGAFASRQSWLRAGRGALFGSALFLLQDELANSVSGMAADPRRYPWQAHARGLVSHIVYGIVLDSALRLLAAPRRTPISSGQPLPQAADGERCPPAPFHHFQTEIRPRVPSARA